MATTRSPVWRCREKELRPFPAEINVTSPARTPQGLTRKSIFPGAEDTERYTPSCAEAKTAHTNTQTHTHTCTVLVRKGKRGPGCLPGVLFPSRTFLTKEFKRFTDSLKEEAGPKGWSLGGRVTLQADRSWPGLLPLFKLQEPAKPQVYPPVALHHSGPDCFSGTAEAATRL